MNLTGIAKKLHEIRRDNTSGKRGRPHAILTKAWEELSKKEIEAYEAEVAEVIDALEKTGHFVDSHSDIVIKERRANPLKVVRKKTGNLKIIGG